MWEATPAIEPPYLSFETPRFCMLDQGHIDQNWARVSRRLFLKRIFSNNFRTSLVSSIGWTKSKLSFLDPPWIKRVSHYGENSFFFFFFFNRLFRWLKISVLIHWAQPKKRSSLQSTNLKKSRITAKKGNLTKNHICSLFFVCYLNFSVLVRLLSIWWKCPFALSKMPSFITWQNALIQNALS